MKQKSLFVAATAAEAKAAALKDAAAKHYPKAAFLGREISQAEFDVMAERRRQIEAEGWSAEHDDLHAGGQIARAGACYAAHASAWQRVPVSLEAYRAVETSRCAVGWPWSLKWWKPKDPRRDLVRAAALIIAEIERLDRRDGRA